MHIFSFFIDQHFRFNLPESTIRMWLKKSDGLDYRGPSYHKPPTEKMRFQGRFQVCLHQYFLFLFIHQEFLVDAPDDINIEAGPSKYAQTNFGSVWYEVLATYWTSKTK